MSDTALIFEALGLAASWIAVSVGIVRAETGESPTDAIRGLAWVLAGMAGVLVNGL